MIALAVLGALNTCNAQNVLHSYQNPKHLQMPRQKQYFLDSDDVLGIFVEGVLGKSGDMPPINYPEKGSNLAPSTGYPIVVRKNGEISLPLLAPIPVRGLTVSQVEEVVRKQYIEQSILNENSRILVSLMRKRTINVTVIRGDQSDSQYRPGLRPPRTSGVFNRSDFSQRVEHLNLPHGDNDLLNALVLSGGIPGVNAKPNVRVYREPANRWDGSHSQRASPFPRSGRYNPNGMLVKAWIPAATRRTGTDAIANRDPRLQTGDVVIVEARPTRFFYTGGLLGGGQFPIPNDTSLDVLQAVAIAGGNHRGQKSFGPINSVPPSELVLIRKQPNGSQMSFRIDLNEAYRNPGCRFQVKDGDYLILQYSPRQNVRNLGGNALNLWGPR